MRLSNARALLLFNKYYNKTASLDEIDELFVILKSTSDDGLVVLMRKEWDDLENLDPIFKSEQSTKMFHTILPISIEKDGAEHESNLSNRKIWFPMLRRVSVAALMIIFIGFSLYSWFKPSASPQMSNVNTPVFQDLPPGGDKAILTLANGRTIVLDSAKNGILASTRSFKVMQTESGEIAYHPIDKININTLGAELNTITTPRGGEYRVILPDGSKVWLNSESSIKFPGVFVGNTRKIELEGEAYFEIAKNAAMPFIVKTNKSEIEVIGTHFNVKAYNAEDIMKTTLLEGSIKITGYNSSSLLKPGQQAQIIGQELKVINRIDVEAEIAWKNGLFQFKDTEIKDVMRQAALWYDLNVTYDDKMPEKHLTGKISRNVKASEFLNILDYAGVKFKILGNNIILNNK